MKYNQWKVAPPCPEGRRALEEAGFAVGEEFFLAAAAPAMFEVPARAAKAADRGR